MKLFNLQDAKNGAKLCTRDGRNAEIILWEYEDKDFPLLGIIVDKYGNSHLKTYSNNGYVINEYFKSDDDLFIK